MRSVASRTLVLAIVMAALAVAVLLTTHRQPTTASASDGAAVHATDAPDRSPQDAAADDSQRWHVLLWTLLASGGAAGVGLLLFLARIAMGWTKPPPPPQEDASH